MRKANGPCRAVKVINGRRSRSKTTRDHAGDTATLLFIIYSLSSLHGGNGDRRF